MRTPRFSLVAGTLAAAAVATPAVTAGAAPAVDPAGRQPAAAAPGDTPVPSPVAYRVRSGDTLWAMSRRFGVPVTAIAAANHIADPDLILAGAVLTIPSLAPAPTAPHPATPPPPPAAPRPAPPQGPEVVVPSVTGATPRRAAAALTSAGLVPDALYGPPNGRVFTTWPAPGSSTVAGSHVAIYTGMPPAPPAPPHPTASTTPAAPARPGVPAPPAGAAPGVAPRAPGRPGPGG